MASRVLMFALGTPSADSSLIIEEKLRPDSAAKSERDQSNNALAARIWVLVIKIK